MPRPPECNSNASRLGSCCNLASFTLPHRIQARWQAPVSFKGSERLPERPVGLQEKHELPVVLTRGGIRPLTLPSWRSTG